MTHENVTTFGARVENAVAWISFDYLPIEAALRAEAYWLYQATSRTPALKRFKWADDQDAQFETDNQRSWPELLVKVQAVNE